MNEAIFGFPEFLQENSTVFFTIIGSTLASILSFSFSFFLQRNANSWRVKEKLVTKRIEVHQTLLRFAQELTMVLVYTPEDWEKTCISFFRTNEEHQKWNNEFFNATHRDCLWYGNDIARELKFLHGFFSILNLYMTYTSEHNEIGFDIKPVVGDFISDDLIEEGVKLTMLIHEFYRKEISKTLTKKTIDIFTTPTKKEIMDHFPSFVFFTKRDELDKIVKEYKTAV